MSIKLGLEAKLYRQTSGTRAAWPGTGAAPNLTEITNVKDVEMDLDKKEVDVTTRGSAAAGFSMAKGTLKTGGIDFEMLWDPADGGFTAIQAAWAANTTIALAALDQDKATTGAQGLWADFDVIGFKKSEPLEDVQSVKVTVKPTYSAVPPAWVTVAA